MKRTLCNLLIVGILSLPIHASTISGRIFTPEKYPPTKVKTLVVAIDAVTDAFWHYRTVYPRYNYFLELPKSEYHVYALIHIIDTNVTDVCETGIVDVVLDDGEDVQLDFKCEINNVRK